MNSKDNPNPLLTRQSLHLSLSPPLFPDKDPNYDDHRRNHPHFINDVSFGVRFTRFLGRNVLKSKLLNKVRDSGTFRSIVDALVTLSTPSLAITHPSALVQFVQLGSNTSMTELRYGRHPMQVIHLYKTTKTTSNNKKLIFFVHGGAWGSGLPWMYRLVASSFLEEGMNVAIIGYRTYPCAEVNGQVHDIEQAATFLAVNQPSLFYNKFQEKHHCCLMGHSSGAHIAMLMIIERIQRKLSCRSFRSLNKDNSKASEIFRYPTTIDFDSFVGLSGPYSIAHHFEFESGRGVEELSPMKPACGHTLVEFLRNSPAIRLKMMMSEYKNEVLNDLDSLVPHLLLVHGIEDSTVPFTATVEAAAIIRSCGISKCNELYMSNVGHEHVILDLMLGGKTKDEVHKWLSHVSSPTKFVNNIKRQHSSLFRSKV